MIIFHWFAPILITTTVMSDFCSCNVIPQPTTVQKRFHPERDSLLIYLLSLPKNTTVGRLQQNYNNLTLAESTSLEQECHDRTFNETYYDKLLYSQVCASNPPPSASCPNIKRIETADDDYLQDYLCDCISEAIEKLDQNRRQNVSHLLEYHERFIEDFPFCEPFKCPYWVNTTSSKVVNSRCLSTLIKCVPTNCRYVYYLTLFLDISIVILVVISNITIITIRLRTAVLRNSYG